MLCFFSSRQFGLHRMGWAAVAALGTGWACANAPADAIRQALAAGQFEQASKLVQQEKQRQPQDPETRFLEGVVQAQLGQTDKAIETFRKLVESHPGLVEAHNNLGVLYASKGRLEEARKAFETGMQANASYAALHRNLADVQSQLVKQTYAKALQVDSKARHSVAQLSLLASLQPRSGQSAPVASAAPPSAPAPVSAPAPAVAPAPTPNPLPGPTVATAPVSPSAPAAPAPSAPHTKASAAGAGATTPAPAAAASAAADTAKTPVAPADAAQSEAVRVAVLAWAKAWSRKDVGDYLQAYASSFVPPDKQSRSKWESERKLRIVSKKSIAVDIKQLKIKVDGKSATAQFQQIYSSDNFTGNSRKTLDMVRQGDRWLIVRETVH
jgi:tetratricopeptide (TPR) repeat protein